VYDCCVRVFGMGNECVDVKLYECVCESVTANSEQVNDCDNKNEEQKV
jgi:hypothetical protein